MRTLLLLILFPLATSAQFLIKGQVLDDTGNPLPGASVHLPDSQTGTTSNENGEFSLHSPAEHVSLTVSFIGYQPQRIRLSLPLNATLVIRLAAEASSLEEVTVSTGYQVLSPEQTTGSFSKTGTALLNRRVSTDLISRLEDLSPGLVFNKGRGGAAQLLIRGQHTINSSAAPLIVIDNFPYDGDLANINPNDVESVTVLKDASAASIWGSRAGNGVIVITTKAGKVSPMRVSFTSNVTSGNRPDLFYQPRMSTADFIELEQSFYQAGRYTPALNSVEPYPLTPVAELLHAVSQGSVSQQEADRRIQELAVLDVRNDYHRYLYRKSLNQQYALNLSGGDQTINYYLSGGYDANRSALAGDQGERYTFNLSTTWNMNRRFQMTSSVYYTAGSSQQSNPGLPTFTSPLTGFNGTRMYPYAQLADDSGNPLELINQYRLNFLRAKENAGFLNWAYSPLQEMEHVNRTTDGTDLRLNLSANYQLSKALSLNVLYQYNSGHTKAEQLFGSASYFARNEVNRFTRTDASGRIIRPVPVGGILDESLSAYRVHNPRILANYAKSFAKGQELLAMGGFELRDYGAATASGRHYGYDDRHATSQPVDYTSLFVSSVNPAYSFRIDNRDSRTETTDRYLSYFANAAYTYQSRYTFSLSGRRDMSNLFGVSSNQRGVPLWSAGMAWNLNNESFYTLGWLPRLKLRATYGAAGNSNKNVSAYTTASYSSGVDQLTGLRYATILNPPNPLLRWEQVNTLNLGLDFEWAEQRFTGSVDYYLKQGRDLIGERPYPGSSGVKSLTGNYAQTRGNGLDARINSHWIRKDFGWSTLFNLSYVTDRITRYDIVSNSAVYLGSANGLAILPLEGRPLFSVYSLPWAGLDPANGDPRGYLNGEPDKNYYALTNVPASEMIYNGPARPVVSGAVINSFTWKGISLSVNVNYKLGYYFRHSSINYRDVLTGNLAHGDYEKRWMKPGDELHTQVPAMPLSVNQNRDAFYAFSEALVSKGDHIRLQDINLSYQPGKNLTDRLPFQSVQLYLYLNNLGILWKADRSALDPDYYFSDYRPPLSTSLGLKANF
jgi:TonB-linked SusC/RagA family outer membrane protein